MGIFYNRKEKEKKRMIDTKEKQKVEKKGRVGRTRNGMRAKTVREDRGRERERERERVRG